MAPIRVALIGLSPNAATSWAAEGHLPYLLSPHGQSHYRITAIQNSSLSSAEAAKKAFSLPPEVKTYDDPEKLAQDDNVDLVVVCTRVDVHAKVAEPSIKAGKATFVEWPLTESLTRSESLLSHIPASQIRNSIIGLQGRVSPPVVKLIELLKSGRIGKVLSTSVSASGTILPRSALPVGIAYFTDRKIGGNQISIHHGHAVDFVHHVLGEWASPKQHESWAQIQRPEIKILNGTWTEIAEGKSKISDVVKSNVPDLVSVHGALKGEKEYVTKNATMSMQFRTGPPFKGQPGFTWSINGELGEILVTSPLGPHFNSDSYGEPITIQVHNHTTDEVESVQWDWAEWQKELLIRGRSIGELYDRYAEWVEGGKGSVKEGREWPTLGDALERAKEIEVIFEKFDKQVKAP